MVKYVPITLKLNFAIIDDVISLIEKYVDEQYG